MSRFDKSEIEDFFRSTLHAAKFKPSEWNDPGDGLFDIALERIEAEKANSRKAIFLGFIILGLSSILGSIFYFQYQELNQAKESLEKLENKFATQEYAIDLETQGSNDVADIPKHILNDSKTKNKFKPSQTTSYSNSSTESDASVTLGLVDSPNTLQSKIKEKNSIHNDLNLTFNRTSVPYSSKISAAILSKEKSFTNPSSELLYNGMADKTNFRNSIPIESIAVLGSKRNASLQIDETHFEKQPQLVTIHKPHTKALSYSLTSGINHSSFAMAHPELLSDMSLSQFSNYNTGYQVHSQLNYSLSDRFTVGVQTVFYSFENNSLFKQNSEFNQANIQTDNGEITYIMPINVMTPIGSFKSTSALSINSNTPALRTMATESKTVQNIHVLNVGLVGSYAFISTGKLQGGVRAALGYNRILSQTSEFDMTISTDNVAIGNITMESDKMSGLNYNYASLTSGVFFDYSITDQLFFTLNTNYSTTASSILNSQNNTIPKTYLRYFENNIGLSYRF